MSATAFEKQGTHLTVKPEGRLDTLSSPVLEKEMQQHLEGIQEITIDFEKVNYISSAGLRILLTTQQRMDSRGGSMRLIHVSELILETFEMVGITDMITIDPE